MRDYGLGDQGWLCGGGGTKLDIEVYYLTAKFLSPFIFKPLTASDFFSGSTFLFLLLVASIFL